MPSAIDLTADPVPNRPNPCQHSYSNVPPGPGYTVTRHQIAISMLSGINKAKQRKARKLSLHGEISPERPLSLYTRELAFAFLWLSSKGAKIHRATPAGQPNAEH
ncbi:hypothetical protein THAR02_05621 [Trichoderma harzianum]|uniref:Uncharacterized protein n=1 Tax=Trichoderma harzianum TaxID=5544 RepID=A0A0F9ZPR6_TRIHA|nr:hypothetical protein THAR02_05621 [Trichoderma harzianum]